MLSVGNLTSAKKAIEKEIEAIRLRETDKLKDCPKHDQIACLNIGESFFDASYWVVSTSKIENKFYVKITPYDIIGDENLTLEEKNYCRYLQIVCESLTKEHYGN